MDLRWIIVEVLHSHMINDPRSSIASFYKHLAKKKGEKQVHNCRIK
jgi:hypothetical protein